MLLFSYKTYQLIRVSDPPCGRYAKHNPTPAQLQQVKQTAESKWEEFINTKQQEEGEGGGDREEERKKKEDKLKELMFEAWSKIIEEKYIKSASLFSYLFMLFSLHFLCMSYIANFEGHTTFSPTASVKTTKKLIFVCFLFGLKNNMM